MKLVNIDTKITAMLWDEEGEETEAEMTVGEFLDLYTVEGLLEIPLYFPGQVPRAKWKLSGYGQISDAGVKWFDKFLQVGFFYCSACKQRVSFKTSFCPNCGAKMEEV